MKTGESPSNGHAFSQAKFTPKGVQWLAKLLVGAGVLGGGKMQESYKTKAALQGRQHHNKKTKPSQDIAAADHVNNYGKIPVIAGVADLQLARAVLGQTEGGPPRY